MTNEAVEVEGPYEIHDFVVASGTGILKGVICQLTSPRTASASAAADIFAGIAASEKSILNGDVSTRLGLYTKGVFKLTAAVGPTITDGSIVSLSGANLIKAATAAELLTGAAFGKALQDITSTSTGDVMVGGFT